MIVFQFPQDPSKDFIKRCIATGGETLEVRNKQVFVDGKHALLTDVKAGYVASAAWKAGGTAHVLQAFDLSARHAARVGVVDSVSTGAVVLTETGVTSGATVSIPVNAKTRVLIDGKPAKLAAVEAGYTVVITANDAKGNKPAHELRFLRPV